MSEVESNPNQNDKKHQTSYVKSRQHLVLYTIALVFAFLDVVGIIVRIRFLDYLKHVMMICFIIIAIRSASKLVVAGQIFGIFGDILLMIASQMKEDQDSKKLIFISGVLSFLVGHILYTTNNFRKKNIEAIVNSPTKVKISLILLVMLALSFYLFQVIYYFVIGIQAMNIIIVVAYGMFLNVMVMSTVLTYRSKQDLSENQYYMRVVGSFLFLFSDSTIMYTIVYKDGNHILQQCVIIITYDIAQLLILKGNQLKSGLFGVSKEQKSQSLLSQLEYE